MADVKARKHLTSHDEDELMSAEERSTGGGAGPAVSEEPESEEAVDSQAEEDRIRRKEVKRMELRRNHEDHFRSPSSSKQHHYHYHHHKSRSVPFVSTGGSTGAQRYAAAGIAISPSPSYRHHHHQGRPPPPPATRAVRPWDEELDAEGELDPEGDYLDDEQRPPLPPSRTMNRSAPRRPWPIGLADLDSPSGR